MAAHDVRGATQAANRSTASGRHGGQPFIDRCIRALPAGTILDVGTGYNTVGSSEHRVVGIDIDPSVLNPSSNTVGASVGALPFRAGAFDGALLKDVLEHVPDPVGALEEVRRVCHGGSQIIATVPRAIPRAVWADPTHIRGFTQSAITQAFQMSGWEITAPIRKIGSIPGAGHIEPLLAHAETLLRLPVLGHWFGLNWIVRARPKPRFHG